MTIDEDLYDPWARPDLGRPQRTEDLITRDGKGMPRLWLPDGSRQWSYSRPSSWGGKVEDTKNLNLWYTRVIVEAYLDHGDQSRTLRARRAALGPWEENKDAHDELNKEAKKTVTFADQDGTALHAMTERNDLGLDVTPPDESLADLQEWRRLTSDFTIVELPDGRPGVEVFVAMDYEHPTLKTAWGKPYAVRLAGTFDRLWRYPAEPCPQCKRVNYIGDLKSGKASSFDWAAAKTSVQEAIYSRGMIYRPNADDTAATRAPLPDVCQHRAITLSLPSGTGQGRTLWTDISGGFDVAVDLVARVQQHRNRKNWMVDFTPLPDIRRLIDESTTQAEVQALWRRHPGPHWDEELVAYASARVEQIGAK